MKITNKLIKSLKPCKNRYANYLKFYKGKEHTPRQFMGLKHISHKDKVWVSFRLMPINNIRFAVADIVELVLPLFESKYPNDLRPRQAIEATRAKDLDVNVTSKYAAAGLNAAAYYAASAAAAREAANYAFIDPKKSVAAAIVAYSAFQAAEFATTADVVTACLAAATAFDSSCCDDGNNVGKKIRTIVLKYWK